MVQIGTFSKICQVSVKTLRYYDRIGILRPLKVDAFTGYRYYGREQLERMLFIQKLKRYGFSLEEIQPLLSCGAEDLCRELRRQRTALQWRQMELGMTLQELELHLQTLERTGDNMELSHGYEIRLVETRPTAVLSCRKRMGVDDFGRYYGVLYERVAKERLTPSGVFGAMYHDEEFNRDASDMELFLGIQETDRADRILEGRQCAMTVHRGTYATLPEAYAALVSYLEENGYRWTDAPYDIYTKTAHNGFAPEDWETEVYFPIRKKTV